MFDWFEVASEYVTSTLHGEAEIAEVDCSCLFSSPGLIRSEMDIGTRDYFRVPSFKKFPLVRPDTDASALSMLCGTNCKNPSPYTLQLTVCAFIYFYHLL